MPDNDTEFEAGRVRYIPLVATDEQRKAIENSALYGLGDVRLIAVNIGDLIFVGKDVIDAPYVEPEKIAPKSINISFKRHLESQISTLKAILEDSPPKNVIDIFSTQQAIDAVQSQLDKLSAKDI